MEIVVYTRCIPPAGRRQSKATGDCPSWMSRADLCQMPQNNPTQPNCSKAGQKLMIYQESNVAADSSQTLADVLAQMKKWDNVQRVCQSSSPGQSRTPAQQQAKVGGDWANFVLLGEEYIINQTQQVNGYVGGGLSLLLSCFFLASSLKIRPNSRFLIWLRLLQNILFCIICQFLPQLLKRLISYKSSSKVHSSVHRSGLRQLSQCSLSCLQFLPMFSSGVLGKCWVSDFQLLRPNYQTRVRSLCSQALVQVSLDWLVSLRQRLQHILPFLPGILWATSLKLIFSSWQSLSKIASSSQLQAFLVCLQPSLNKSSLVTLIFYSSNGLSLFSGIISAFSSPECSRPIELWTEGSGEGKAVGRRKQQKCGYGEPNRQFIMSKNMNNYQSNFDAIQWHWKC